MSSGQFSNHTWSSRLVLVRLAKTSATLLHEQGTKQKSENAKRETWSWTSPTMCPCADWSASLFLIAWMTLAASPSNITSWRLISTANWTTRLQASVSTDWGSRIHIETAPMTAPTLSRMTTPKPAASVEENRAPSKLALYRVCVRAL